VELLKAVLGSPAVTGAVVTSIPTLAVAALVWLLNRKPAWLAAYHQYKGYVFQAIEWAEKIVPAVPGNRHIDKFEAALNRLKHVFTRLEGRLPTPAEAQCLEQAIEYGHAELERTGVLGVKMLPGKDAA